MKKTNKENLKPEGNLKEKAVPPAMVGAKLNYLRMSPTKVRVVVNVVKGMGVNEATAQLQFMKRLAKEPVLKLLNSAIANAVNNFQLDRNNLYIKIFTVDGGPMLKRWRPRAFGRAGMIRKRMSHLHIILSEKIPSGSRMTKAQEIKKSDTGSVKVVNSEDVKKDTKGDKSAQDSSQKDKETKRSGKGFTQKVFNRKTG